MLNVPVDVVSVWPCTGVPVIVGGSVDTGVNCCPTCATIIPPSFATEAGPVGRRPTTARPSSVRSTRNHVKAA